MLRGSFCWFIVTTPAEVAFRLVLGPPKRAELVPLQASARNCRFQVSCSLKALNMESSALGGMGGQRLGNTPLSVPSVFEYCWEKAICKGWPFNVQFLKVPAGN